jgi:hypothetical protein
MKLPHLDLAKMAHDILTAGHRQAEAPHDAERCKRCIYANSDDGKGYCYMFKEEPTVLCQQFKAQLPKKA